MATGYVQIRTEATPGSESNTPTYGTKVLYAPAVQVQANSNPTHLNRDDEIRNLDEPISHLSEKYAPDWSLESRMYPDTVGMLLTMMLGAPTTTAGNNTITDPDNITIPTGAHRHVWTAPFIAGPTPKTADLRIAYKDQSFFEQLKGAATQQMQVTTPAEGGARVQVSGPALYLARINDPNLTPAYEALTILPFLRSHMNITWLSGGAAIEDFNLNIANPVTAQHTPGAGSRFPDLMEKADTPVTFTGSIPKRSINATDFDALINATGFAATIRFISTTNIVASYPYKLFFEFTNCQYVSGGPNALENKRRIGSSFEWRASSTGTSGHAKITLVNATTSYT
jgi:hypothetical protein